MTKTKTFLRILALGLPGIAALVLFMDPPQGIPRLALAVNPLIMLVLLGVIGLFTAQRAGFRSCLLLGDHIDWSKAWKYGAITIGIGLLIAIADYLTLDIFQPGVDASASQPLGASLVGLLIGVTYGGATEEILMRWGLMSVIALGLMRFINRDTALLIAMIVAAALFAVGHLPILFATNPDVGAAMIGRVLFLNGVLGIWFGWLYARHDLETAIAAHAGFHIGVFLFKLVAL